MHSQFYSYVLTQQFNEEGGKTRHIAALAGYDY